MLGAPYRVAEIVAERGDAWTLVLQPERQTRMLIFEPGQFVWMTLRASPFAFAEHPFSISSSPTTRDRLELTIKELGDFTRTIKTVQPGEAIYLDGPFGAFSIDRYPAAGYVFVAGGIGSAPMMSMLRALADRGDERPHLLILANSRWERVTFREAVHALKARLNLRVVHCLEEPPPGWDGESGYVTAAVLERHLPRERNRYEYFVCGPEPMIRMVENALYQLGVPLGSFHTELFDLV
jgi:predicted ferric reductase